MTVVLTISNRHRYNYYFFVQSSVNDTENSFLMCNSFKVIQSVSLDVLGYKIFVTKMQTVHVATLTVNLLFHISLEKNIFILFCYKSPERSIETERLQVAIT